LYRIDLHISGLRSNGDIDLFFSKAGMGEGKNILSCIRLIELETPIPFDKVVCKGAALGFFNMRTVTNARVGCCPKLFLTASF